MDPENVEALKASSKLVLLEASAGEILRRIRGDTTRPLVNVDDREKKVRALLEKRQPTYQRIADIIVLTDPLSPIQVADKIQEALEAER
jgi:shikimate dehydrogenase